jgi:hypothetical protein
VNVQDAGEGEAAEARTDDRDWCRHSHVPFRSRMDHCSKITRVGAVIQDVS